MEQERIPASLLYAKKRSWKRPHTHILYSTIEVIISGMDPYNPNTFSNTKAKKA